MPLYWLCYRHNNQMQSSLSLGLAAVANQGIPRMAEAGRHRRVMIAGNAKTARWSHQRQNTVCAPRRLACRWRGRVALRKPCAHTSSRRSGSLETIHFGPEYCGRALSLRRAANGEMEMNAKATKLQAAESDLKELMADVTRAIEKAQQAVWRIAPKAAAATTETESNSR